MLAGLATAFVDYFIHPGTFGAEVAEAIVTGIGAAILSYLVGTITQAMRHKTAIHEYLYRSKLGLRQPTRLLSLSRIFARIL